MKHIRLKTNLTETALKDRLQYKPEIIELHLEEKDLIDTTRLLEVIRNLKSKNIEVYLHHPMRTNGKCLDILSQDEEVIRYYDQSTRQLVGICEEERVKCVIHAHYSGTESSNYLSLEKTLQMKKEIEKILVYGREFLLWEDTIAGLFSYANPHLVESVIKPLNLPLNIDISHSFIALRGDNNKLHKVLEQTKDYVEYFHVVDSMGEIHDGLELGAGKVDWKMVKPYLKEKPFIFEIGLKPPHIDSTPMINSVIYYNKIA